MKKLLLFLSVLLYADYYDTKDYAKAYPILKKECYSDNAQSCYKLGFMNEFGLGTGISYIYAYKYYHKSCELNDNGACAKLGYLYYHGLGIERNVEKAEKLLKNACEKNVFQACDDYAYLQKKEHNQFMQDELLKACYGGIANSCTELADHSTTSDGYSFYLKACSLGSVEACQKAAKIYISSARINQELFNFNTQSDTACKENNATACNAIAYIYKELSDIQKAKYYYDLACKQQDSNACANLAVLQEHNEEFELGISNYEKACKYKDAYSCSRLGYIYQDGLKDNNKTYVKPNKSKSSKYFKQACELGISKACK